MTSSEPRREQVPRRAPSTERGRNITQDEAQAAAVESPTPNQAFDKREERRDTVPRLGIDSKREE